MTLLKALLFLTLAGMTASMAAATSNADVKPNGNANDYRAATVAEGLDRPWGLAFLPDGGMLVTERPGRLRRVSSDGVVSEPLAGVPPVYFRGQGGMLDVILHPDFARNRFVYLSYSHGDAVKSATRIARAVLGDMELEALEVIFTVTPTKDTPQHYGGTMVFLGDGTLLLTTGDGFDYREQAQNLQSHLGKILRIADDGSVPADNPFVGRPDAAPEVWSYGHRNPQGLALDAGSNRVYQHEHGPRGGDELNLLQAGHNYGWPAITHGVDYSGAYVSPFSELPGMEQPLMYWVPSIAPSGLAFYHGEKFPEWQGDLFLGALVDREVRRIDLEAGQVAGEQALFSELNERIRNIKVGPDEHLYLVTDSEQGRILRVERR
jgi:glucose/arabinose dehydrogenase